MARRNLKTDYSEPFQPMETIDMSSANVRVPSNVIEAVAQYHLVVSQIRRLNQRRQALRPIIVDSVLREVQENEEGKRVTTIAGRKVQLTPRYSYKINEDEAIKVLKAKGLLDKTAVKVLKYKVKPSLSVWLAQKIWSLLTKVNILREVEVSIEWEWDEEAIEQFYLAGDLTDEDIDSIVIQEPVGQGYILNIDEMEESTDES